MRTDIELSGKDLSVSHCLIEHVDKVGVFKDVLHFLGCQKVFNVLRDTGRNTALLSEALPDLNRIGRCLFFTKKNLHLIHVIPGGSALCAVRGNSPPHLILHHQHADLFQLLTKFLDVIAHKTVCDIHVGPVVKHIKGTGNIDFKCSRHMSCFRLVLL